MTRRAILAVGWIALGCQKQPVPDPASSSSAAIAASAVPSSAPLASASVEPEPAKPIHGIELVESARIKKLASESNGRFVAELDRTPPARGWVTFATKEAPLLPRAHGAYFAIAERIAPGLVAPTALRAFKLEDIAEPADPPTKARLKKSARVLADGTLEAALTLAPAPGLERVDLADVLEGRRAWRWEMQLSSRDPIPEADRTALVLYQQLLAVDYVAGNSNRRFVHRHPKSGRITAAENNEAFSTHPDDNSVHDTFERLSHHVNFSKALRDRIKKLTRDELEKSLRWGNPSTLLVTPKQVEEAVERAHTIDKLIEGRIKQKSEDAVLVLP